MAETKNQTFDYTSYITPKCDECDEFAVPFLLYSAKATQRIL